MSEPDSGPTQTALAAKAFLERIDNGTCLRILRNRAVLAGWVGARDAGLWDTHQSDAVARAALGGILDLIRAWASECGPAFTCPACGMTSHNPNDVREGYCGNCHDWMGASSLPAP